MSGSGERDNSVLRVGVSALKISKRIYSFYQLGNRLPNLKELGEMIASEGKAIAQDVGILVGKAPNKEKLDALFRVVVGLDSNDLKDAMLSIRKSLERVRHQNKRVEKVEMVEALLVGMGENKLI